MAWKQTRDFNENNAGKVKGYCLQNVRKGYGIGAKYSTARKAADHAQLHQDRNIPQGVEVPLYYDFWTKSGNEGHINVRMADGRVWSDGNWFSSLEDYERRQSPDFIGWGENVNGTRVIQWEADAPQGVTIRLNGDSNQHWNVRLSPSMDGAVMGGGKTPAKGGQQYGNVEIDGNGWAKIVFTGKTGWVGPKAYTRI